MIKRVVEISSDAMRLSVRNDQLVLRPAGDGNDTRTTIPCEDIAMLVIEHPRTTFTQSVVATLAELGAAVVFCGRNHLPAAVALPVSRNTEVVLRLHDQINVSKPIRKQLWKQLVVAKICAQARNLLAVPERHDKLKVLADSVRSGDPNNVEAHAARIYWSAWLDTPDGPSAEGEGRPFRRDKDGDGINALLNYGYAILRAAVGRAIVIAGLAPALGIHHHNRSNAFALADDLVEPLRPLADAAVQRLVWSGQFELDKTAKTALLGLLYRTVALDDQSGPLMVVLHRYTASFVRCLRGEHKQLAIPQEAHDDGN